MKHLLTNQQKGIRHDLEILYDWLDNPLFGSMHFLLMKDMLDSLKGCSSYPPLCFEPRHLPSFLIHQAAISFFLVFLLGLDFFAMRKDFMEVWKRCDLMFLKAWHGMSSDSWSSKKSDVLGAAIKSQQC